MAKSMLSVVLPFYNGGEFCEEAIESVLNQDCIDRIEIEIIVVDDASNLESSLLYLKNLSKKYPEVKFLSHKDNKGPSAARNKGVKYAKGDYIAFIDADDKWPVDKIKNQLQVFKRYPKTKVVGGLIQYWNSDNSEDPIKNFENEDNSISHVHMGACLIKREVFDAYQIYFNEELRFSEDWDWWLKVKEKALPIHIINEITLIYRVHQNNTSTFKSIEELGLLHVLKASLDRRKKTSNNKILPPHKNESEMFTVSVVIPLFNGEKFIKRALLSVMNQTVSVSEIIVVDDGSWDNGVSIIENDFLNVIIIKQENKGVAHARNIGWKNAKSNWVAFLDQDDEWYPSKIEEQLNYAKKNSNENWISCLQKNELMSGVCLPPSYQLKQKVHECNVPSGWLIRKSVLASLGGFDVSFLNGSDMELLSVYQSRGEKEKYLESVLVIKHIHGENAGMDIQQTSSDILRILKNKIARR